MTDEEKIRHKLDMINRNSTYGLPKEDEDKIVKVSRDISMIWDVDQRKIAKIIHDFMKKDICSELDRINCPKPPIYIGPVKVKTLKERLEEATMHTDCEDCIKRDICTRDVPKPCKYRYTEEERIADQASDKFGAILHNTYLHPTYRKKKEEQKMNATSVQVINNVKDMNVTFEKSPLEETRIIMSVSTDDDTYEINCSGFGCEKFLRKNDFVHVKEYEYINNQLMDREKEINKLKQQLQQVERDNKRLTGRYTFLDGCYKGLLKDYHQLKDDKEEYEDKIEDLQHKYNLEREANEAQRKFFRKYAGEGVEIEFHCAVGDDEYTYVIVDKEEYKALKNIQNNVKDNGCYSAMIHGKVYNPAQLVDRVLELEKLKTPTIENFANEEPSSRSDILDLAKKCVCGKREQDYGTPESNFQLIADLWNQYLFKEPGAKEVFGIGPMDVAMMMGLMKIARIRNGGGSGDSFVDLAGYAACGGEIWHSNKETDGDSSQETN